MERLQAEDAAPSSCEKLAGPHLNRRTLGTTNHGRRHERVGGVQARRRNGGPRAAHRADDRRLRLPLAQPHAALPRRTARQGRVPGVLPLALERPADARELTLERVVPGDGSTVAFEWSIASQNRGQTYRNQLCIFFDVDGDRVSAHREYVNELDPQAIMNGAVEPSAAPPRAQP
jgi:ketosteroid isomerase-like protein